MNQLTLTISSLKAVLAFIDHPMYPSNDALTVLLIAKIKLAISKTCDPSASVYFTFDELEAELKERFNKVCGYISQTFQNIILFNS